MDIVDNMLNFSRKSDIKFVGLDIGELIDKTIDLCGYDYDWNNTYNFKNIRIVKEYNEDDVSVYCDPNEIQQVFLNIIRNGAYAMSRKYEMLMNDDSSEVLFKPTFTFRVYKGEKNLIIELTDNGVGIKEEILGRIFDPFFTTGNIGVASGLGLSVSNFIITEIHGGKLEVKSTVGEGSTFTVKLPFN